MLGVLLTVCEQEERLLEDAGCWPRFSARLILCPADSLPLLLRWCWMGVGRCWLCS